ncbi:hypothetical protein CWM47_35415 [Spirosoma pollinicola]|uniref:Uncharacterized protein n=1 Tax=Spirosoma pollinicola TaxID=2057025 RepID=A0A2K8ZA11_9BACT|nr:hypothetical protein CWM47_35415 [Spirosoma pollinicola]
MRGRNIKVSTSHWERFLGRLVLSTINEYPSHTSHQKWEEVQQVYDSTMQRPHHDGRIFIKSVQFIGGYDKPLMNSDKLFFTD